MKALHTKAPWFAVNDEYGSAVTDTYGQQLCSMDCDFSEDHCDVVSANARLIAAAPDLLAALCSLRDAIIGGDPQEIADALHRDALPAITKASGS